MTDFVSYPFGAPCWVETLQPDPDAAVAFFSDLLGWTFDEGGPNGYRVARLDGRRVAGIRQAPAMLDRGAWVTYVLVADLDRTVAAVREAGGEVLFAPLEDGHSDRTALFTDPSGAAFGARQGSSPTVAERVDAPNAWQMSALHTSGLSNAGIFYNKIFGWRLEPQPHSEVSLWRLKGSTRRAADSTLPDDVVAVAVAVAANAAPVPVPAAPAYWAVNIQASNADDLAARAVELGGTVLMPPADAPDFRNALLADPSGGVLAISQVRKPSA
ncbi:VOC family protein [Arthrobacter sp. zg-Y877]|uniref:VOC family protein n=1 Tax=Arthrobacter sp. zg-Y877 TaxID=3049074 RepID=UPI0025A3DEE0|nr:VOC family protein [Arthrobacter sp. zg-Y877]MDM7990793.1 VOC family protein [Arthrobacter sp. zg-Y877]